MSIFIPKKAKRVTTLHERYASVPFPVAESYGIDWNHWKVVSSDAYKDLPVKCRTMNSGWTEHIMHESGHGLIHGQMRLRVTWFCHDGRLAFMRVMYDGLTYYVQYRGYGYECDRDKARVARTSLLDGR